MTDERMQFVARRRTDGGTLQVFGIFRKTGCKISIAIRSVAFRG